MRILVTGGAGFIGSHLTDAFLARGDEVVIVDDLSTGRSGRADSRAIFHKIDIMDGATLTEIASDFYPELICHLAAQIDVRRSVIDPGRDATTNIIGTINVLEAARVVRARVLFASSGGAIYGKDAPIPSPENASHLPESPYGTAKLCAEQYFGLYNRLHGASHSVLRLANVYGPRQDPSGEAGVIAVFCANVLAGEVPIIYGNGLQTRDYIYVGDVIGAFLAAASSVRPGTWNIGTGTETSVLDLITIIGDIAACPVIPRFVAARPGELQRSAITACGAARDLDWRPAIALRDGVAAVYHWMKANAPDRPSRSEAPRLSQLCGYVFPGQPDGVDFSGCRLVRVRCPKSGGDEDAAELGEHVCGGRLCLGGVPGRARAWLSTTSAGSCPAVAYQAVAMAWQANAPSGSPRLLTSGHHVNHDEKATPSCWLGAQAGARPWVTPWGDVARRCLGRPPTREMTGSAVGAYLAPGKPPRLDVGSEPPPLPRAEGQDRPARVLGVPDRADPLRLTVAAATSTHWPPLPPL
jgi:UDP-glucose 4-epimerase